jgi:ABC-type multidrug transport system ATPase subunit
MVGMFSGAGKTSLLNALAGRTRDMQAGKGINGRPTDDHAPR